VASPSVFVLPAEVGWSDIGSWNAVYELLARKSGENVSAESISLTMRKEISSGAQKKLLPQSVFAILSSFENRGRAVVCVRSNRAQDVGKVVKCWKRRNSRACFRLDVRVGQASHILLNREHNQIWH